MRVDIFLSSLLFGITLLTCALAIMHLICGGLIRSSNFPPHVRRRIRMLLLGSTISISLLIFLVRLCTDLSGRGLFTWSFDGREPDFFPRRITRIEGKPRPNEPMAREFRPEGTWTLFEKPSRELYSQKQQSSNFSILSSGVTVWASKTPGPLCQSWIERVRTLGIEPKILSGLRTIRPGSLVIACPMMSGDHDSWESVRDHVFKGGSLLAVGRHEREAAEVIQSLMRIISFREPPDQKEPVRVIVGGPRVAWGGFPSGLVLHLGGGTDFHREMILAEVAPGMGDALALHEEFDGHPQSNSPSVRLAALVTGEYGSGRVAWTSLPAKIFGKSDLLHGQAWEILSQRVFAHLLQIPQAGLELWPSGNPAPVSVSVSVESNPKDDVALSKILKQRKISASHYVVLSEALEHPGNFSKILGTEDEIGITELDHASVAPLDFYERYDRIKKWIELFANIPNASTADAHTHQITGALTTGGVTAFADQYAALMANRLDYALIDPFGDQISPYRVHLTKTARLIKYLAEGRPLDEAPSSRSMVIWPHRAMDDVALTKAADGFFQKSEIKKLVIDQYRHSRWAGGPYLFRVSTNGLGGSDFSAVFASLLDALKEEGAVFSNAAELIRFKEIRSEVDVVVEPIDRSRVPADLEATDAPVVKKDDSEENWDDTKPEIATSSRQSNDLAFRVTVKNGSAQILKQSVLRVSEPGRYQALARKAVIENGRSLSEASNVRVIHIQVPDLQPGDAFTIWLTKRE